MKPKKLILNLFIIATAVGLVITVGLVAALGLVTGCASTGNDKAANTAKSLTQSSHMIEKGNTLIDQTLVALNDLVSSPNPDMRKQFNTFSSSVNELGSIAKDVTGKAEEMKSQGADYFANWDQETARMQNEDIRQRSDARKYEVASNFARISQQYNEARTTFAPFMSELRDVQKFLGTDLTIGGLAAIKDAAAKATRDAAPVKESLTRLAAEFKSLSRSMSSASGATK